MFQAKLSNLLQRLKSKKRGILLPDCKGSAAGKTKHPVFGLGVLLSCVVSLIFSRPAQAGNETLTLETYYPAPYGSYSELQLSPKITPSACNANSRGTMYYDDTAEFGGHIT